MGQEYFEAEFSAPVTPHNKVLPLVIIMIMKLCNDNQQKLHSTFNFESKNNEQKPTNWFY